MEKAESVEVVLGFQGVRIPRNVQQSYCNLRNHKELDKAKESASKLSRHI
jgi:hypothetical protein